MIAGGEKRKTDLASVEAIQIYGNKQRLPNLPSLISGSPSMFLHNKTIMLCGGDNNLKTCLKLQEGTWTEYNSLKKERKYGAVVSTTTTTFIFGSKTGWILSEDTYEYLEKNASDWKLGKTKIPHGFSSGCSIAISQDEIWLIGGHDVGSQKILSFNVNNQNFIELPIKLLYRRDGHQCDFIPGTRSIIVTGGSYENGGYYASTEIINVENRSVTVGPSMNFKRGWHGIGVLIIDAEERVVVFGGQDRHFNFHKSVEVYNAQTKKWELKNIQLNEEKYCFGFMTIKGQP